MQLVVLGKGDQKYEEFFHWAADQYPGRMAVRLDYNEALSMSIYSGADLFLMPSKSEPCGLSQMIAMRYGTVPIVRETGGLKDTVQPYEAWRDAGNGFSFRNYASGDMLYVIREAVYLYKDYPEAFGRLRQRAMESDFSWARSARDYMRIYANITGQIWTMAQSEPEEESVEAETAAVPAAEAAAEVTAPAAEEQPAETPVPAEEPVPAAAEEVQAEKPARRTTRKTAAKKAPAKTAARKTTARKAAAKEEPEELPAEAPAKKAAAKTTTRRTAAKKTASAKETPAEMPAEVPAEPAAKEKPAKKSAVKKEKTTKKGPAKTEKEDAAE